jgi:hypothetical protein
MKIYELSHVLVWKSAVQVIIHEWSSGGVIEGQNVHTRCCSMDIDVLVCGESLYDDQALVDLERGALDN